MKTERTITEIENIVNQHNPDGYYTTSDDGVISHHDPVGTLNDFSELFTSVLIDTPVYYIWHTAKRALGFDKQIDKIVKSAYKNITGKTWKIYTDDSADFSGDLK